MGGKAGAGVSIMTDPIRKAIEASREREAKGNTILADEFCFREALAVSLELFELAPKECTCTTTVICPHCLLKDALRHIERIVTGG